MKPIVIESPFRASGRFSQRQHERYLDRCILDSLGRRETPYASHRMLTGVLDDAVEAQRDVGIYAGYPWQSVADLVAFYTDLGWSEGMTAALGRCKALNLDFVERSIGKAGIGPA